MEAAIDAFRSHPPPPLPLTTRNGSEGDQLGMPQAPATALPPAAAPPPPAGVAAQQQQQQPPPPPPLNEHKLLQRAPAELWQRRVFQGQACELLLDICKQSPAGAERGEKRCAPLPEVASILLCLDPLSPASRLAFHALRSHHARAPQVPSVRFATR